MTEIFTSLKEMHKYEITIFRILQAYNFNIYKLKSCIKGEIEEGFKIEFTEKVNKQEIEDIFKDFKAMFGIGCFYLKHESFEGCVIDFLKLED